MYNISYEAFTQAYKLLSALHKENIQFDVGCNPHYSNDGQGYKCDFIPQIKNITNPAILSKIFELTLSPLEYSKLTSRNNYLDRILRDTSADKITVAHEKLLNSTIKFYPTAVLDTIRGLQCYIITKAPPEEMYEGDTYRTVIARMSHSNYGANPGVLACVSQKSPIYNYLDKGHIVIVAPQASGSKEGLFITNQMTLDICYMTALCSIHFPALESVLVNGVFINGNAQTTRLSLLKAEKALPPRFQDTYRALKDKIQAEFEKNAQNVMIGKLSRNEIGSVVMNEIKLTSKSATYETISIEAEDLREVVFKRVNPNDEFDIFALIQTYVNHIEERSGIAPYDEKGLAKKYEFKINGIPICVTTNTASFRRTVNGFCINKNEIARVLHRASCHHTEADFNAFIKSVSRMSLFLHDVLAQGLPVKTYIFDSDTPNTPAHRKHPKLKFKKVSNRFNLIISAETELPVKKMMEFVHKVHTLNRTTNMQHIRSHEGKYVTRNGDHCEAGLKALLPEYIMGVTEAQITTLLKEIKKEREEADKKSEESLKETAKMLGATREQKNNVWGWKIEGKLRTYFVEEESLKTHDYTSNKYICIVNGKGDQGVGMDSLITRLFALKNDSRVTGKITTLAGAH